MNCHALWGSILGMRKPRMLRDGGRYHVIARANRKEMILESAAMKDLFLETVARAKKKYDFRVENFTVMGNHFHMIIQPINGSNLSAIMQWIMSVFAARWNRLKGCSGHVWGERFFSRILDSLQEYLRTFAYIDHNPVRAGQVTRPEDWQHGGLWHLMRGLHHIVEPLSASLELLLPMHRFRFSM